MDDIKATRRAETFFAILAIIYFLGIPVSSGVMFKMGAPAPAPILAAPLWPLVGLAYLGYRLAP